MEAFQLVLIIVVAVAVVIAIASAIGMGDVYRSIGKGGLSLDEPDSAAPQPPDTPASRAEAEAEIRQMVEAKSARREARGERPLDVDAEVAELTGDGGGHAHDAGLREEVRQLVEARNERRVRKGQEPLDVDAEVERQLRELG
ncbi:MAG: hypothetical protein ACR2IN_02280 [Thermoleophilaceae bacterium]